MAGYGGSCSRFRCNGSDSLVASTTDGRTDGANGVLKLAGSLTDWLCFWCEVVVVLSSLHFAGGVVSQRGVAFLLAGKVNNNKALI